MADAIIRDETPADHAAVETLVAQAFASPVEAELVRLIRASPTFGVSLVADEGGEVVGHVMLSRIELRAVGSDHRVMSLSPLAVRSDRRRAGIGRALVREALRRADERGEPLVCLEGDPRYYGRLGFEDARPYGITFELPDWAPPDAGQVYRLGAFDPAIRGRVVYPEPFVAAERLRARSTEVEK